MVQHLRALFVLAKYLGSIPGTHMLAITVCNVSSRGLLISTGTRHTHVEEMLKQAKMYVQFLKKH